MPFIDVESQWISISTDFVTFADVTGDWLKIATSGLQYIVTSGILRIHVDVQVSRCRLSMSNHNGYRFGRIR